MNNIALPEIAILGGGPVGIETALYARFLGHPVTVFECGDVCQNVRNWESVTLFTPFGMNCSPLGLSALQAQQDDFEALDADQLHTGREWIDRYFDPLSKTDLLRDSIRTQTVVVDISRAGQLPTDHVGDPQRGETPLRVLYQDADGHETSATFPLVIDTTGTWNQPNWTGSGGGPALGEIRLRQLADDGQLPPGTIYQCQILGREQLHHRQGDRFLLVGSGYTAATNLLMLETAVADNPALHCTWLTRRPAPHGQPLNGIPDDRLAARRHLVERGNRLAVSARWLDWRPEATIESVEFSQDRFHIRISGQDQVIVADHLLSSVGFHGNFEMLDALQLHRCYATGGPMNWARSLARDSADCLQQTSAGTAAVSTTEPGFFVIGSKSYGRDSRFLFATGLLQIRDVFRVIGGRQTLDLYAAFEPSQTATI